MKLTFMRLLRFSWCLMLAGFLLECAASKTITTAEANNATSSQNGGKSGEATAVSEEGSVQVEQIGPITRAKFKNGLTAIFLEKHSAPVVAIQVWVDAGSAYDKPGQEGIAHLHEHMLFKGTKKRALGEIAQAIEGAGGDINAWTSYDHTVYEVVVAARYFDLGLEVLADALQNTTFAPDELEREKRVVIEEIKRNRDQPGRWASDLLFSLAFRKHPYRQPILGTMESVQAVDQAAILQFFKTYYRPEHMTLLMVGDFDRQSSVKRIQRLFHRQPQAAEPPVARASEGNQRKLRLQIVRDDIQEAHFNLGWHIPSLQHADSPALDVLATLLGQGESARLNLEVRRRLGLVNDVYAYAYSARDPGLFVVGGSCPPDKTQAAMQQLMVEVSRLAATPVSASELAKVKTMIESDALYQRETVEGLARRLGFYQTLLNDPNYADTYLNRVLAITPADIRRVAATYLIPENLSLVLVMPKSQAPDLTEDTLGAAITAAAATPTPETEPPKSSLGFTRMKIKNGPVLLIQEDHTNPLVAVRAAFLGGSRYESSENNGINNFLAGMLTRGTQNRSAADVAREIDAIAGGFEGFSGRNSFGLRAEFPSRYLERGLSLFADCLLHPTFPESEIKRERELVLEEIRARDDNLSGLAFDLFAATLYPNHPYRLPPIGTRQSVAALKRTQLTEYRTQYYTPDRMVLAITGDVEPQRVSEEVRALFSEPAAPENKPAPPPVVTPETPPDKPHTAEKYRNRAQAHFVLGFLGTTLVNEDRFPLEVLMAVLAGQGGRLFVELRDRLALAYAVTGFSLEGIEPGYLAIYLGVDPKRLDEAIAATTDQLRKIIAEPIAATEIERAQRYLVGNQAISLQRLSARAGVMAFDELYGLGYLAHREYAGKILAVTAADVSRVAQKYLTIERPTLAIIRPKTP